MTNKEQLISKIKESAIQIQENDLKDLIDNIEHENNKSSIILALQAGILTLLKDSFYLYSKPLFCLITTLFLLAIGIALYNIIAKRYRTHTDVDAIFKNGIFTEWEVYLDSRHDHLNNAYESAKKLLVQKADNNAISLVITFIILGIIFITN